MIVLNLQSESGIECRISTLSSLNSEKRKVDQLLQLVVHTEYWVVICIRRIRHIGSIKFYFFFSITLDDLEKWMARPLVVCGFDPFRVFAFVVSIMWLLRSTWFIFLKQIRVYPKVLDHLTSIQSKRNISLLDC